MEISTAGIPNAVSKMVNEFNTLNRQEAKIRAFKIGKNILSFIAVIAFIIMFVFAGVIAKLLHVSGGSSYQDIAFIIRCVSFAILVFPFLSVTRGFFQGHNIISVSSFSQVIEQLVRVGVILGGSYLAIHVLHLDLRNVIGIAVFGAFVGGAFALMYVYKKLSKNKHQFHLDEEFVEKDAITNKEIIRTIIKYALPTIIISIAFSLYNTVDMVLVLKTMDFLGYPGVDAELIATDLSTWASKISIIVSSVGIGLGASMVPAMVEAYTLKNYIDLNHKFNKAIEMIIFVSLPMCIGISFLSNAIWTVFYGFSTLGIQVLTISIFVPLFSNLYTVANYTLQSMNKFKLVYISAISGIATNALLDVPLMLLCDFLGMPSFYGATLASIIGFSVTLIMTMFFLKKKYNFHFGEILKVLKKMLVPLTTMTLILVLFKLFIKVNLSNRLFLIGYIAIVSIIGALTYFIISYYMGLFDEVLGKNFLDKIKNKFRKNKKEV